MNKGLQDSELYESRFRFKEQKSNARFFAVLLAAFIALFCLRAWWTNSYGGVVVDGNSMRETLYDGEQLLMKYVDKNTKAARGDVIVVYVGGYAECASVKGDYLIKRLIAVEGDSVRCKDGKIEICYAGTEDFVPLAEPYAYYGVNDGYKDEYDFAEYTVGEGEIFFLGDNRSSRGSSVDSRYKEELSHLNKLYKVEDIYGVVPAWAIEHNETLAKIFF